MDTNTIEFSDFVRALLQIKFAKNPQKVPDLVEKFRKDFQTVLPESVRESNDPARLLQGYIQHHRLSQELIEDYRYEVDLILRAQTEEPDPQQELAALVGLQAIKKQVLAIRDFAAFHLLRQKRGLSSYRPSMHMLFQGSPGTGKTTVARILGRFFQKVGFLPKGHVVEVSRGDLVAEYIGQTAAKTASAVEESLGGVLFVDEAYLLTQSTDPKDYGSEALGTLVKLMEDKRDEFVVIFAGYPDEMRQFVRSNPGLASRIPFQLTFPDYSDEEMVQIVHYLAGKQDFTLTTEAEEVLRGGIGQLNRQVGGNGRLARNVLEQAIMAKATEVMQLSPEKIRDEDLLYLDARHFHL